MYSADGVTENGRAASTEVLNPRRALTRAPSSDLAFLNTVLDVTQKLAQQAAAAAETTEGGVARVLDTRVSGSSAHRIKVECVQCDVPVRRVSVSGAGSGWAIEHMVGGHISVIREGVAAAVAGLRGASDVRCVWWITDSIVGVVAVAPAADALWAFVIDTFDTSGSAAPRTELAVPARARVGPVAAQGSVIVCADTSTGALSFWNLEVVRGSQTGLGVVRTGRIEGVQENAVVVDLRWVAEGVGLAATRAGAFWFDVRKESARSRCAPLSWLQPGRRLSAGLSAATVLSWRWQEAVVAVAGNDFPPRSAALCLPSATGVTFYSIGEPVDEVEVAPVQHTRTFERGWVWLCGSSDAYAVLSASRQQATVCCMPGGEPLYTLETRDGAVIQDGWMMSTDRNGMAAVA
ncbi:hypothetical protein H4R27_003426 [Coemansia aciculifera]|nr:hypothetical protein GGH93_003539 [Coemansia aciculifera]KAJ2882460.1 hypothetical protein H4R27_003426 [Coemansia aciculifera]